MRRAIVLMLDSLGIGASADASRFGDTGADTFGHIAERCANGAIDIDGRVRGALEIPQLCTLGLAHAAAESCGAWPAGLPRVNLQGAWGYAVQMSAGKDTPSGHWEMAGVPVLTDWGYFADTTPCFPVELTKTLISRAQLTGLLGNCHASGTAIIEELGEEHIRTGKPICYTSADSVFQIAAHETHFGLERLYAVCQVARELVDAWNIGRVIARPFAGDAPGEFIRTADRRDYTTPPLSPTLLDQLKDSGGEVITVGKVSDIFAGQGVSRLVKASGNMALFDATVDALHEAGDRSLIFTNFVDFDMLYGHRRDVAGYAGALEALDERLPELLDMLMPGDLVIATADHGCDPTAPGHDHTREHVPVLAFGPGVAPVALGRRTSFSDMGQTLAEHLGLTPLDSGESFLADLMI
ncbi:phosphopentomutase [Gammaproteobacteria bacterium]|nr:phosphopentomutase [Gammaproteobacteria bacterium]